jgi:TolA-binding protein
METTGVTTTDGFLSSASRPRSLPGRALAALSMVICLAVGTPVSAGQTPEDNQLFLAGFQAYKQKDYAGSQAKLQDLLERHPGSQLRDLALYWLARSHYRAGNHRQAARYFAQFVRDYPDNPLKEMAGEEMFRLVTRYERVEKLPPRAGVGTAPGGQPAG